MLTLDLIQLIRLYLGEVSRIKLFLWHLMEGFHRILHLTYTIHLGILITALRT